MSVRIGNFKPADVIQEISARKKMCKNWTSLKNNFTALGFSSKVTDNVRVRSGLGE